MRIGFVTNGTLKEFSASDADTGEADVLCFSFHALGEVDYERELKGETELFSDVAQLSKKKQAVVVCGCFTNARGAKRKSVVVAERGRILGVSDMLNRIDGAPYRAGAGIKIYDTLAGKLGIVVAEDLYFPRVIETLSVCGADVALCIFEQLGESLEQAVMRAQAFMYGIPVCICAYGYAEAADVGGRVNFATPQSPYYYEQEGEREYHLVETRQRGFYGKGRNGI